MGLLLLGACKPAPHIPKAPGVVGDESPPICEGAAPLPQAELAYPQIGSTYAHSCVLFGTGRLSCWGRNHYRELGDGTWNNHALPEPVIDVTDGVDLAVFEGGNCVARRSGAVACWGNPWGPVPADVPGLDGVVRVGAWKGTACGVRRGGTVVCTGAQDGDGYKRAKVGPYELPGIEDAVDIVVGGSGICVLHACGRVSCGRRTWQKDDERRWVLRPFKAVGGLDDARAIVMASSTTSSQYSRACALRANGRVSCFPQDSGVAAPPDPLGDDAGFVGIGGGESICVFNGEGVTKCFGPTLVVRQKASDPEIPDEATVIKPVGVSASGSFRCATTAAEHVYCWGRELGGQTDELHLPMPLGKFNDAAHVSTGKFHTCVTRKGGEIGCFGPVQLVTVAGDHGRGGYSYLSGQSLPGLHFIAETAVGDGFICARTQAGEVFCYGRNDKAQLGGDAKLEDRLLPTPVLGVYGATQLVAAPEYACALLPAGEVRCWGLHPNHARLGVAAIQMPELTGAVEIAAGNKHLCARMTTGQIKCIGDAPSFAQAGSTDIVQIAAGAAHTCVLLRSGHVACAGAPGPTAEDLPEPAIHIAAGGDETCAVLASGRVSCWGGAGWTAPWTSVENAKKVTTSGTHACALLATGEVECWGKADNGRLGNGSTDVRYPPTEVPVEAAR